MGKTFEHLKIGDTFYRISGDKNLRYYKCKVIGISTRGISLQYEYLGKSKKKIGNISYLHPRIYSSYETYEEMLMAANDLIRKHNFKVKNPLKIELERIKKNKPYLFI
jgi:hypothetical protein